MAGSEENDFCGRRGGNRALKEGYSEANDRGAAGRWGPARKRGSAKYADEPSGGEKGAELTGWMKWLYFAAVFAVLMVVRSCNSALSS